MNRQFKYIQSMQGRKIESPYIVVDCETTGLNPRIDTIVGIAFATKSDIGYYTTDVSGMIQSLNDSNAQIICHNAVFDYSMLKVAGFTGGQRIHDTMLLANLLDPDRPSLNLKELAKELIGDGATSSAMAMDEWLNANSLGKESISRAPKDILTAYAAEDALNTYDLFQIFIQKVKDIKAYFTKHDINANVGEYYLQELCPLIRVVSDMQLRGVKLDLEAVATKKDALAARQKVILTNLNKINESYVEEAERILHERKIAERKKKNKTGQLKKVPPRVLFNWDSNDHLKLLFLRLFGLKPNKKTAKGKPSIDSSFFETLVTQYPWVQELIEYKELKKLTSTYLQGLLEKQEGGFIHANFNLAGTATGRLSSSKPNLQNLPKHGGIKGLFVPRKGFKFVYADYSQVELRIAAHLSNDVELLAAFTEGKDLHQTTADLIHGTRDQGKTINFAIIYNASGWRIAEILGLMENLPLCTNPEKGFKCQCDGCVGRKAAAKKGDQAIRQLFGKYKGLKNYVDKQKDFMLKYNIAVSQFGKLRRLPGLKSQMKYEFNHALKAGFNLPIQSFGASLCKRAMVQIANKGYHIINQIHDSILVEVPENDVEQSISVIKGCMENIYKLKVPLIVEPKVLTSFEEKE